MDQSSPLGGAGVSTETLNTHLWLTHANARGERLRLPFLELWFLTFFSACGMLSRVERRLINREKLQELVNQIDGRHTLDPEVEDVFFYFFFERKKKYFYSFSC